MPGFLDAVKSGGGDMANTLLNAGITAITGGFKDRPSWRDLQFMNDAQNRLWPDEIKRQGQFLEGLAPSQAAAHNTFQDATYQAGVDRETAGIKSMAAGLGMSPWELTGQTGSAAPLPPDAQQAQGGSGATSAFLQGIVPLQIASANNKAMLTAKQMDNQTALKLEGIRQGGFSEETGQGKKVSEEIDKLKSERDLVERNIRKATTEQVSGMIQTMAGIAPKQTLNVLGNTLSGTPGWKQFAKLYQSEGAFATQEQADLFAKMMSQVPDGIRASTNKALTDAADTIIKRGGGAVHWAAEKYDEVTGALGKLGEAPGKLMEYLPKLGR